ncbi:STAS domain-containing protein [Kitasatospora sp. NPDC096147]|uniref:STAS domain-containing protein n=1 Tax=Kitasatospora sp. NPDC096147 TaxID=3364093 RepID=UPI00380341A6
MTDPGRLPPQTAVEVRTTEDGTVVCVVTGELDIESIGPAHEAFAAVRARRPALTVLDLSGVGFCDSSGLNLLLQLRLGLEREQLALRLAAVPPPVGRVLELTGAATVFSLHPSVEDATRAGAGPSSS